jgi:shikimate kinase
VRGGRNIVLIGMPGAGKSTVGVLLAKHLGLGFVDTDLLIQERAERRLQEIVDGGGFSERRRLEEEAILGIDARASVIATGGSAVYSARAMHHLARCGTLVYLRASLGLLESRLDDYDRRDREPAGKLR